VTKRSILFLMAATAVILSSCAPPPAPIAAPAAPQGDDRFIIDPRIGYAAQAAPANARRFDEAWRAISVGDFVTARKRLDEVLAKDPGYEPAKLAEAAIALRQGRTNVATPIVERALARRPGYMAAEVYSAEIEIREKQTRQAYERYREIESKPGAPAFIAERISELRNTLFDQLYNAALVAPDDDAVRLLRDALAVNPSASAARILLVQKLVAQHKYDDARNELEPVLNTADVDRSEVQEALAEIDISRGRYESAIARYERLARREPRFAARFETIKEQYAEANMPPQFRRAIESDAITRGDLAVLMYWKVASVRFASNMAAPPIATDIGDTPGRDEIVRAMALGIYQVDPVTRRVGPYSPVTTSGLARTAARLLAMRGAACARGAGNDPQKVLAACAIVDPTLGAGVDAPASGRVAAGVMEQVDRVLSR
jgi:tetratricopeptide (TPR) repeat protein